MKGQNVWYVYMLKIFTLPPFQQFFNVLGVSDIPVKKIVGGG